MAIAATLNANAVTKIDYSPAEYLKNYALSVCIAEGTQQKRSKTMPRPPLGVTWSSAIILWKRIPPSGRWQKNFWQSPMTACLGEPMTMAKCIDLVHSQELQAIIKKYQGKGDN